MLCYRHQSILTFGGQAPELLQPDDDENGEETQVSAERSKQSDVYALGMVRLYLSYANVIMLILL